MYATQTLDVYIGIFTVTYSLTIQRVNTDTCGKILFNSPYGDFDNEYSTKGMIN
jgi:hypothetical protein